MTKQEEIREGMWMLLIEWQSLPRAKQVRHHLIDDMLKFQSEEGVMINLPTGESLEGCVLARLEPLIGGKQ